MEGLDKVVKAFGTKRTDIWALEHIIQNFVKEAHCLDDWKNSVGKLKEMCDILLRGVDKEY